MLIIFELIVGVSVGLEYFDDGDAWIISLGIIRVIILPKGQEE